MALEIISYNDSYQERWDQFVINRSANGTFLQTKNFLNYHPKNRFIDASLMVMQGSNIVAVIPACCTMDQKLKCFFSHKGSTYGGIVLNKEKYNVSTLDELIPALDDYLQANEYKRAIFKFPSGIFTILRMDLLDYYMSKQGYSQYNEVSFIVYTGSINDDLLAKMSGSRRRDYRYSLRNELKFQELRTKTEIEQFYNILCKNLLRFETTPVHTIDELFDFKEKRLVNIVNFYGVYYHELLIAGAMLFKFGNKILHAQYLAQNFEFSHLYPMVFLDFELIKLAQRNGFTYFSFGISTEEHGKILNKGLSLFKEGFGCEYCINRTYIKDFK